jgi:hypothetical protein
MRCCVPSLAVPFVLIPLSLIPSLAQAQETQPQEVVPECLLAQVEPEVLERAVVERAYALRRIPARSEPQEGLLVVRGLLVEDEGQTRLVLELEEVAEGQRRLVTQRSRYVVDLQGRLLHAEIHTEYSRRQHGWLLEVRREALLEGQTLRLSVRQGSETAESEVPWPEGAVPDVVATHVLPSLFPQLHEPTYRPFDLDDPGQPPRATRVEDEGEGVYVATPLDDPDGLSEWTRWGLAGDLPTEIQTVDRRGTTTLLTRVEGDRLRSLEVLLELLPPASR